MVNFCLYLNIQTAALLFVIFLSFMTPLAKLRKYVKKCLLRKICPNYKKHYTCQLNSKHWQIRQLNNIIRHSLIYLTNLALSMLDMPKLQTKLHYFCSTIYTMRKQEPLHARQAYQF